MLSPNSPRSHSTLAYPRSELWVCLMASFVGLLLPRLRRAWAARCATRCGAGRPAGVTPPWCRPRTTPATTPRLVGEVLPLLAVVDGNGDFGAHEFLRGQNHAVFFRAGWGSSSSSRGGLGDGLSSAEGQEQREGSSKFFHGGKLRHGTWEDGVAGGGRRRWPAQGVPK